MSNPYQSPQLASPGSYSPNTDRDKLRRVARYQQFVIYALLANIVLNVTSMAIRGQQSAAVAIVVLLVALVVVACSMVAMFLLANELMGVVPGVLCALLMVVPCISLITLLVVNQKATSFLQERGVKVGFMGANPNTI
jgi:hypothetical protein